LVFATTGAQALEGAKKSKPTLASRYGSHKPENEKEPETEKRVANRFIKDQELPDVDKDAMARDFLETFNFIYDYQSSRVGKHVRRIEKIFQ
jgi:hypothetical protein